jgi:hypothetical protein
VKNFLHRKIKFYLRTGNPPSPYKQLSSNSSRTGKNRGAGPKIFVYIRVANLEEFSPKKANFGILLKNDQGIFRPIFGLFKVLKGFFKIWVGSTLFTGLGLMQRKSTSKCTKRQTIHFLNFDYKNNLFLNFKSCGGQLEGPELYCKIVKTSFYFMRLSL